MSLPHGKFITLEGIDGAGKSTHLQWIADRIAGRGVEVVMTREPGGTPLGEKLRGILLNDKMHGDTEALLMFAARAEHVQLVIRPALARGAWVVSDRFTDATFAYQCGGRGVEESRIAALETWVQQGLQPDLTLLFDAPLDIARGRVEKGTPNPDKFEREKAEFFDRVRSAYVARAEKSGGRIQVIDSRQDIPAIRGRLDEVLSRL
jgi:dTMP kinase